MSVITHVVDNRVFLLGLDELYRARMKRHERSELRECAQSVAAALGVTAKEFPLEGYYSENEQLTEYFHLMRTLQGIDGDRKETVSHLPEFQRLVEVTSSPIYGTPVDQGMLLPAGRDPLSRALKETWPDWTIDVLTRAAKKLAVATDDFSLVGLAARVADAVVITALRESVVLYAELVPGAAMSPPRIEYKWKVDSDLARQAAKFVDTFNALFTENLPAPVKASAEAYWNAAEDSSIFGRCVRLGFDDTSSPHRYYHWAICRRDDNTLMVQEFWHPEVWSTARYHAEVPYRGPCPEL